MEHALPCIPQSNPVRIWSPSSKKSVKEQFLDSSNERPHTSIEDFWEALKDGVPPQPEADREAPAAPASSHSNEPAAAKCSAMWDRDIDGLEIKSALDSSLNRGCIEFENVLKCLRNRSSCRSRMALSI